MTRAVFVDTSAWVAFFARRDRKHSAAVSLFERLGEVATFDDDFAKVGFQRLP